MRPFPDEKTVHLNGQLSAAVSQLSAHTAPLHSTPLPSVNKSSQNPLISKIHLSGSSVIFSHILFV